MNGQRGPARSLRLPAFRPRWGAVHGANAVAFLDLPCRRDVECNFNQKSVFSRSTLLMNSIIWLVGAVVIVIAILSFFGLR